LAATYVLKCAKSLRYWCKGPGGLKNQTCGQSSLKRSQIDFKEQLSSFTTVKLTDRTRNPLQTDEKPTHHSVNLRVSACYPMRMKI